MEDTLTYRRLQVRPTTIALFGREIGVSGQRFKRDVLENQMIIADRQRNIVHGYTVLKRQCLRQRFDRTFDALWDEMIRNRRNGEHEPFNTYMDIVLALWEPRDDLYDILRRMANCAYSPNGYLLMVHAQAGCLDKGEDEDEEFQEPIRKRKRDQDLHEFIEKKMKETKQHDACNNTMLAVTFPTDEQMINTLFNKNNFD